MKDLTQISYVDNKGKTLDTKMYWYGLYGNAMNTYNNLNVSVGLYFPVTSLTYTNICNELKNNGGVVFGTGKFDFNSTVLFFNQYTINGNKIKLTITTYNNNATVTEESEFIYPTTDGFAFLTVRALNT